MSWDRLLCPRTQPQPRTNTTLSDLSHRLAIGSTNLGYSLLMRPKQLTAQQALLPWLRLGRLFLNLATVVSFPSPPVTSSDVGRQSLIEDFEGANA
jgi:hypothetical protein